MFKTLGLQLFTIRDFMQDPELADLSFRARARTGIYRSASGGL